MPGSNAKRRRIAAAGGILATGLLALVLMGPGTWGGPEQVFCINHIEAVSPGY